MTEHFNIAMPELPFSDPSPAAATGYAELHGKPMPTMSAPSPASSRTTTGESLSEIFYAQMDGMDCAVKPLAEAQPQTTRVVLWSKGIERIAPHDNVVVPAHILFSKQRSYLVMPYHKSYNLLEYRAKVYAGSPLPEEAVRFIALDILCALYHLRLHGVAHRTLHAGHVLIDPQTGVAKVTDLSYAQILSSHAVAVSLEGAPASTRAWADPSILNPEGKLLRNDMSLSTGSAMANSASHPDLVNKNVALEDFRNGSMSGSNILNASNNTNNGNGSVNGRSSNSSAVDIWGFGCCLHAMCSNTGEPFAMPRDGETDFAERMEQSYSSGHYSEELFDLIRACLQPDPTQRPTVAQLMRHNFIYPAVLYTLEASRVSSSASMGEGASFTSRLSWVGQHLKPSSIVGGVSWAVGGLMSSLRPSPEPRSLREDKSLRLRK